MNDVARVSNAAAYGYIWLNRIFVKRGDHFRLWKTSDIRLSRFDAFVILLTMLLFMLLSVPVIALLMRWSVVADNVNLWPLIFLALAGGWWVGRMLAKMSPYSRYTGENIIDWAMVAADRRDVLLARLGGHRFAVTEVISWVNGKPQPVEAVEWIGSARAPDAPPRTAEMSDDDLIDVYLVPLVEPTDWVAEVRQAERERVLMGATSTAMPVRTGEHLTFPDVSEPVPPPQASTPTVATHAHVEQSPVATQAPTLAPVLAEPVAQGAFIGAVVDPDEVAARVREADSGKSWLERRRARAKEREMGF